MLVPDHAAKHIDSGSQLCSHRGMLATRVDKLPLQTISQAAFPQSLLWSRLLMPLSLDIASNNAAAIERLC